MKKNQLNKEEEILRDKLNEVEFDFQPGDWDALEKELPSSGGSASWLSGKAIIGAAVIVSLTAAWFINQNDQAIEVSQNDTQKEITLESAEVAETENSLNDRSEADHLMENQSTEEQSEKSSTIVLEESSQEEVRTDIDEPTQKVETAELATVQGKSINEEVVIKTEEAISSVREKPVINGLIAPDRICENTLFTIALDMERELPKGYSIDWYADGKLLSQGSKISGMEFKENGSNSFKINVMDPQGQVFDTYSKTIETILLAELDFTYSDLTDLYSDFSAEVKVDPELYQSYQWFDEDEQLIAEGATTQLDFKKKGIYDVVLKARSIDGCYQILEKPIAIYADFDPMAPNAFSPLNQDGTNDTFMPESFKNRNDHFEMQIMTLSGGIVFETNSVLEEWNGKQHNSGQMMPAGQYFWKASISNPEGKSRTFFGNIRITP